MVSECLSVCLGKGLGPRARGRARARDRARARARARDRARARTRARARQLCIITSQLPAITDSQGDSSVSDNTFHHEARDGSDSRLPGILEGEGGKSRQPPTSKGGRLASLLSEVICS